MKKLVVLILNLAVLTGCVKINNLTYDEIITRNITYASQNNNIKRKGYSYTLLNGLKITNQDEFNDVIETENNIFYLYVDLVSYYNKKDFTYQVDSNVYYSKAYEFENKKGYLEINTLEKEKYLIEIMYNYAKIEVIVKEKDINLVVSNSLSVLSSIDFNDDVLKTLLDEETSQFQELQFDIFETTTTESEYLQAVEDDVYEEDEEIHDSDLIN